MRREISRRFKLPEGEKRKWITDVDDEEASRSGMRRALTTFGYNVLRLIGRSGKDLSSSRNGSDAADVNLRGGVASNS